MSTPASGVPRPTSRQLTYLNALAERTGQTFAWPTNRSDAAKEIRRLKALPATSQLERQIERNDWAAEAAARDANCDVPIRPDEMIGYGANCSWSGRS
jgi:hypothetical protein